MSDVERLLAAFESGASLRPRADTANLVDLTRALATLAGVGGLDLSLAAREIAARIGPAEHLILVIADGLGMNIIEMLPPDSFLRSHLVGEIRTVFPSTTAVALTTIATGEWPSRHGMTGWWTHLPGIGAATILPFLARADGKSLRDYGVTPERAFPTPPLMPHMQRETLYVVPEKIAGSVYSRYASGDTARLGYKSIAQGVDAVAQHLQAAQGPTYTYFYTLNIDEAAHQYGVSRPEVRAALLELDSELRRFASLLPENARAVVSADHGFLDAPLHARYELLATHDVAHTLRFPPSGDARILNFHVESGQDEHFRRSFEKRFKDRFLLLTVDEVERLELLGPGPLAEETRARLGDYLAISVGADVVEYRPRHGQGKLLSLASHHSGLSPQEMRIPLCLF